MELLPLTNKQDSFVTGILGGASTKSPKKWVVR